MKSIYFALLAGCLMSLPTLRAAEPVITEIMPLNERVLADEDGQFKDWIEIHNPGPLPIDLGGYLLTDNALEPAKWTFPTVILPVGSYLVLFASGKDRKSDPAHLHTNFELNGGGGYVGLARPDSNVVSSLTYGNIAEDVSFGISQQQTITSLLATSAPRILVPANAGELPATWNQPSYSPGSNWTNGIAPPSVGFDTNLAAGNPLNVAPGGTAVQSTINGSFTPNLAINNNFGDFTHTLGTDPAPFWQLTLTNQMAIFNVVLFNRTSCCGSRLRDITLEILSTNESGFVTNYASPLLNPENTGFAYPNGPASLSNNLVSLTGGPVFGQFVRVRRTPDPDLSGSGGQGNADEANVLSLGEVTVNATTSAGLRAFVRNDLESLMLNKQSSAFVRIPFTVLETPDLLSFRFRHDDGFVAFLNGIEVTRSNSPANPAWNSAATADRNFAEATGQSTLNLAAAIPLLQPGQNLLAVHLMNFSANNSDALFEPELVAAKLQTTTNVYLVDATPGAANTTDYYFDEVDDTRFSVNRGFFETPFSLSITSDTPGAVIYYTFNADEPGPGKGILYTGPFNITNTTVVRARAFKPGWKATDIDTQTYLFLGDVIRQAPDWQQTRIPPQYFPATWGANTVDYGMDPNVVSNYTATQWQEAMSQLPSMSVVTEMRNLFDATTGIYANALQQGEVWERPASIELLDPTNAIPGRFQENCGLRIRGGFSRNPQFVKHAFRVFFRREYGAGKLNYPLFENEGAQEFDKFDLRTSSNYAWARESSTQNGTNDTNVREVWSRQTLGAMGQPYRRSRYYHLYLNGQYWGIYETDERPEASYGATYFGGERENFDVVKCGNRGTNPDFITEATDGNLVAYSNLWVMCREHAANPTPSNYFRILGRNPDGTRNPALPVMLDVDNLIDYMLGIFFTGDGDATLSNFLANNTPNNWFGMRDRANPNVGFRFFNSDCEHTLGAPSSQVDRTGPFRAFPGSNIGNFTYANPQYMHEDLMWNPEYRQLFADHVQKHFFNGGALTLEQCTNRWWAKANQIDKAIRANSARWGDAVREPPYGESDWTNIIRWVANVWFPPRANIVLGQLRADLLFPSNSAPVFSQFGGVVPDGYNLELSHTNISGVIYFTLDGSDPRLVGGGINPSAQAYSSPITINGPTRVRARVLIGGVWSALVEALLHPPQDLRRLLITEIMYNPPAVGLVDGDEFEFLEFKNAGTNTLNLSGLRFATGITFTFTNGTTLGPGQFFVIARNPVEFAAKYPGVPIGGVYSGRLDNAGENLRLVQFLGSTILSITYDDRSPWPVATDGHGFSLVPQAPNANPAPDDGRNWRASTFTGGSPGADDPAATVPRIVINEALTATILPERDWIELFNPTPGSVNIGGWFLTDEPDTPKKFRIPDERTIVSGGFTVFDETQFNPTPSIGTSFSLRAEGDDVYLFSADAAGNLTGYSHGFNFGAAEHGVTFGRHVVSTGDEDFTAQVTSSLGATNSGPKIGPIIINEIHYHPDVSDDEFIEIKNITGAHVPLYDPAAPTNLWRINGLSFTFPPDFTLGSNNLLLVVPTTPTAFRAKYNVPAEVTILGPFAGQLQDSGERLALQKPGPPDTNNTVAYIDVDVVRYNDKAPWPPAADGSGPSLQRASAFFYGNDPMHWAGALPTPGRNFTGGPPPVITSQPTNVTVVATREAEFRVIATGSGPIFYQWRHNGSSILNATDSVLRLTGIQLSDGGEYTVLVFNENGSVESAPATLTVLPPPLISQHPVGRAVYIKPDAKAANLPGGTNVTFSVVASTVYPPLTYQWRLNGIDLPGATSSIFTVTNVQLEDEGDYDCALTDTVGTIFSAPARLVPWISPIIQQVSPPITAALPGILYTSTVPAGATINFSAAILGNPPPFGYIWRSNSFTIGAVVSQSQTNVFAYTTTPTPVSSLYRVIVTNVAQPNLAAGVWSAQFYITTVADFDKDGVSDSFEVANGMDTNNAADASGDLDLDGMSNRAEFVAGTDPNNNLSFLKVELDASLGAAAVEVSTVSNRSYTIQFTDALGTGAWTKLADLFARPTNRVESISDPGWSSNRFYRVVVPQQP